MSTSKATRDRRESEWYEAPDDNDNNTTILLLITTLVMIIMMMAMIPLPVRNNLLSTATTTLELCYVTAEAAAAASGNSESRMSICRQIVEHTTRLTVSYVPRMHANVCTRSTTYPVLTDRYERLFATDKRAVI